MKTPLQVMLSKKDKRRIKQIANATRRNMTEVVTDAIGREYSEMDAAGVFRGDTAPAVRRES